MKKMINIVVQLLVVAVATVAVTFAWESIPAKDPVSIWQPITETNEVDTSLPIFPSPVDLLQEEVRETKNWSDVGVDTTTEISFEDAQILMRIAEAEAAIDGVDGMAAVMQVIMNRVESSEFPDNVYDVVNQNVTLSDGRIIYQFSPMDIGSYYDISISVNAHLALAELEKGKYKWLDAMYFENAEGSWQENNREYVCTVGHHKFYK